MAKKPEKPEKQDNKERVMPKTVTVDNVKHTVRYLVHSVGPSEYKEVVTVRGEEREVVVEGEVVELVSEDASHGTVHLHFNNTSPFQVGNSVVATFELTTETNNKDNKDK